LELADIMAPSQACFDEAAMIIPLHLVPAVQEQPLYLDARQDMPGQTLPDYTLAGQPVDASLLPQNKVDLGMPISGPVDYGDIMAFQQLMFDEGLFMQPTRMFYDRLYAFEQLARGHASANTGLRALSMRLFSVYQSAGEWIGLGH
jgi:hypothetical protein